MPNLTLGIHQKPSVALMNRDMQLNFWKLHGYSIVFCRKLFQHL